MVAKPVTGHSVFSRALLAPGNVGIGTHSARGRHSTCAMAPKPMEYEITDGRRGDETLAQQSPRESSRVRGGLLTVILGTNLPMTPDCQPGRQHPRELCARDPTPRRILRTVARSARRRANPGLDHGVDRAGAAPGLGQGPCVREERPTGVIARFVRRITLRSLAASSAKRGVSWDSGSTDGRWCAPRPRSSSRSRRSTRYVPIPTARRAGAGSGPASITPDPVTACASFASTGSDAHSRSCSKPSTASKPTAFTWSASRSVSTPRRRPASSCSTSSAPSRTSSAGSSPSEPATASPRPGNAVEHRVDRRSTRRRFLPLRNSSRPDCHPAKPPNSSE